MLFKQKEKKERKPMLWPFNDNVRSMYSREKRRPTKTFADWPMTTKTLNAQTCAFLYHALCVSLSGKRKVRYWAKHFSTVQNGHIWIYPGHGNFLSFLFMIHFIVLRCVVVGTFWFGAFWKREKALIGIFGMISYPLVTDHMDGL